MNILFLDTKPIRRGAQVFVHELKKNIISPNVTVKRIFLYEEHDFEKLELDDRDEVLKFTDNHWFEKWLFFQPKLYKELYQKISIYNPDIILCNGSRTLKYAALVKSFCPISKAKWIYRVIDSAKFWNGKLLISFFYRHFIIKKMDAAVGVSERSLNEMVEHYRFKKYTTIIPRAIDVNFFINYILPKNFKTSIGIDSQSFVILFLGNFTNQKRPDRFLKILSEVTKKFPQVHGLMVGDGPLRAEMENLSLSLGITNKVTFAGYHQDVRPFVMVADILMLTSDTEGMPGVMLEAAIMKKITITANVGGVKEFIKNGYNGIVIEKNDISFYHEVLVNILLGKVELFQMGENAFNSVVENYSLSKIVEEYHNFFSKIISR